jgi:Pyridoxamine 5'-phosphate oxidase
MGKLYPEIDEHLRAFIAAQQLFFVATAPSGDDGHVNCSPKGLGALGILGPTSVAYVDFVGSGVETIAHLRENGRIVIMFCAFEGPPTIVRLHGRGRVVEPTDAEFLALLSQVGRVAAPGIRSVIHVDVTRISDSCGYGVPRYAYQGQRDQLPKWAERKGAHEITTYQREHNASSIDGLDGLRWPSKPTGA